MISVPSAENSEKYGRLPQPTRSTWSPFFALMVATVL